MAYREGSVPISQVSRLVCAAGVPLDSKEGNPVSATRSSAAAHKKHTERQNPLVRQEKVGMFY